MTQTPSLARMVHYYPPATDGQETLSTPFAAVIAGINDGIDAATGVVDLFLLNRSMDYLDDVEHADEPTPGHWSWPPRI